MFRMVAPMLIIMSVLWTTAAQAQDFEIAFSWDGIERCSSTLPDIAVTNVPEGTEHFVVKMVDLDFTSYNHGGGVAPYAGDELISEADYIATNYRGPCPPGVTHTYEFTVEAQGSGGSALATASAKADFPPK